jgi:NTP pyrophosphatase (non-canonical NTP hydrolase)
MSDIQKRTEEVGKLTRELKHSEDPTIILLFLMEELGETARAYLKEGGHKDSNNRVTETFREEMGDVFYLLLRLAAVTGTDLEAVLEKTEKKLKAAAV